MRITTLTAEIKIWRTGAAPSWHFTKRFPFITHRSNNALVHGFMVPIDAHQAAIYSFRHGGIYYDGTAGGERLVGYTFTPEVREAIK